MYVDTAKTKLKNGKTYIRHLLRTSYWDGKMTRHKTVGNLSVCTDEELEAIKFALKYKETVKDMVLLSDAVSIEQGKSIGAIWLINQIAKRLGIEKALGNSHEGKLALWQVIARVIDQGSRLSAVRLASEHSCSEVLGLSGFSEDNLYENLDWLVENQSAIEDRLYNRGKRDDTPQLFLYDVTSSYLEGEDNELADYGYNRDKKKGKKQIVIGLLCDGDGKPIAVDVFRGNTRDLSTFRAQVKKVSERFGCSRVTMVGDRGMIKSAQVEDVQKEGFHYITAISKKEIETLLKDGVIQMDMFDERLFEAFDEDVRYVIRRNPERVKDMALKRQNKRQSIKSFVDAKNRYLSEHGRAKIEIALRDVRAKIRKLWISGWLKVGAEGRRLILEVDEAALTHESRFDGCYVLKTDLPRVVANKEVVHDRYKDLAKVDRAFRAMKTAHLEVRPVYVRLAERTRAHVFIVMLAYMITRELETCWKGLNLKVSEGISSLSSLCCEKLIIKGNPGCLQIPEPRDSVNILLKNANVELPPVLPYKNGSIATNKKLIKKS